MAKRRMISKDILRNDAFISMSAYAQALYMHLLIDADDDGFVPSARGIATMLGFDKAVLKELTDNRYLLYDSEDSVYIIKHWRMFQQIRADRYTPTTYVEAKTRLKVDDKGAYIEGSKAGNPVPEPPVAKESENKKTSKMSAKNGGQKCGHSLVKYSSVKNSYKGRNYTDEELESLYKKMEDEK